jgi:hypothetical protein
LLKWFVFCVGIGIGVFYGFRSLEYEKAQAWMTPKTTPRFAAQKYQVISGQTIPEGGLVVYGDYVIVTDCYFQNVDGVGVDMQGNHGTINACYFDATDNAGIVLDNADKSVFSGNRFEM